MAARCADWERRVRVVGGADDARERLTEVVAAAVEVAAEAGEDGTYTGDMARTLSAVVAKVGARIAVEAEISGFSSGWREAVAQVGQPRSERACAHVTPMRPEEDGGP
ncbi:hypothetical protein [Streptomyces sp. NPDC012825]|uniref:hypothetical protein n=1 Tax=Streptomyces sp. NPDC012825 TaxID=3364851 RepID=UPI0036A7C6E1